jgi:hypothetical protein
MYHFMNYLDFRINPFFSNSVSISMSLKQILYSSFSDTNNMAQWTFFPLVWLLNKILFKENLYLFILYSFVLISQYYIDRLHTIIFSMFNTDIRVQNHIISLMHSYLVYHSITNSNNKNNQTYQFMMYAMHSYNLSRVL